MILESATLHKLLCDILNNTNVSVDETRWNNIEVRINKTLRALADEIEQKQVEAAPVAPSKTPPVVTRGDGIPVRDQAMGIELFKAQCRISALERELAAARTERAALRQPGMVMVPMEPTSAMLECGYKVNTPLLS